MKNILLRSLVALTLSAYADGAATTKKGRVIQGHVLQRLKDGALVGCDESRTIGGSKTVRVVFVRDLTAPDKSKVKFFVILDGTHDYKTLSGVTKRVDAYMITGAGLGPGAW